MIIKSICTSASGMLPCIFKQEVAANNLANVDTTGYKKSKVEFQDIPYTQLPTPGAETMASMKVPVGLDVGYGT